MLPRKRQIITSCVNEIRDVGSFYLRQCLAYCLLPLHGHPRYLAAGFPTYAEKLAPSTRNRSLDVIFFHKLRADNSQVPGHRERFSALLLKRRPNYITSLVKNCPALQTTRSAALKIKTETLVGRKVSP